MAVKRVQHNCRKMADGGSAKKDDELKSVPVPPREEAKAAPEPREEKPGFIDRAKSAVKGALGMDGTPTITGGFSNLLKKRGEQIDEATGVVKKANGGKIKKVPSDATKPKATAKNLPMPKTQPLHLKNGGVVKGR